MDAKIEGMAQSGALDPALLLTIAKAHTSIKDTDYTREEVKDVMAHLYFKVCNLWSHPTTIPKPQNTALFPNNQCDCFWLCAVLGKFIVRWKTAKAARSLLNIQDSPALR